MHARVIPVLVAGLLLSACGHDRNDQAATACSTEIAKRLSGKTYEIDIGDLADLDLLLALRGDDTRHAAERSQPGPRRQAALEEIPA